MPSSAVNRLSTAYNNSNKTQAKQRTPLTIPPNYSCHGMDPPPIGQYYVYSSAPKPFHDRPKYRNNVHK